MTDQEMAQVIERSCWNRNVDVAGREAIHRKRTKATAEEIQVEVDRLKADCCRTEDVRKAHVIVRQVLRQLGLKDSGGAGRLENRLRASGYTLTADAFKKAIS